jgi:hypothetical protein
MHRKVLFYTAAGVLGLTLACSKSTPTPSSPSSTAQPETEAAPDGSTLKAATPNLQSPTGGSQVTDPVTLSVSRVTGKYQDVTLTYQFQVRSGSTVVYDSGMSAGTVSGNNVTHVVPSAALNSDTDYTWRARATYQGAFGSWTSDASFKSPIGAYIRGNEVRDPLTIGRTVGEIRGPVQFVPGVGMKLISKESHVLYRLPQNLQAGEFSMMVLGADEGADGDKNKVFAMQEGPNEGDITEDDYRMTAELRGRNYSSPGAVTARIIPGDGEPRDFHRIAFNFDSRRWYFWRFSWGNGRARLEVRRDSETGSALYDAEIGIGGHPYRPDPHYAYLGSPVGRAGLIDATLPGGTYKNVYLGPNRRPTFPQ